jgi:hypothetical protein
MKPGEYTRHNSEIYFYHCICNQRQLFLRLMLNLLKLNAPPFSQYSVIGCRGFPFVSV